MPAVLILIIGGFQIAWALHCASTVRWGLETSARTLLLNPAVTASELRSAVIARASGLADGSNLTVSLTTDQSNPDLPLLRASATYTHRLAIAFLPVQQLRFQETVTVPAF